MKRLSKDLKRRLNALALQDAADHLPSHKQHGPLGVAGGLSAGVAALARREAAPRRVALLSNGHDLDDALRFALDTCSRQGAALDLVLYDQTPGAGDDLIERLRGSDAHFEMILLGEATISALSEYLSVRRTLIYLVTPSDDPMAQKLVEEFVPSRGGRLHLPVVLVERQQSLNIHNSNVA